MLGFIKRFSKNVIEEVDKSDEIKEKSDTEQEEPIRAIINGLLYDTSKAKKIGTFYEWINCLNCETKYLYITKNHNFFVVYKSSKEICPTTECEAKRILSRFPDEYQEIFGKVDEA